MAAEVAWWLPIAAAACGGVLASTVHWLACRRLLTTARARVALASPAAQGGNAMVAAALCAVLAWRLGAHVELLVAGWLAVISPTLAVIDVLEQRLPNLLTLGSLALVAATLTSAAAIEGTGAALGHAGIAMLSLGGFFLLVSLLPGGGLGAGDVKLSAVIGLVTGWNSVTTAILSAITGLLIGAILGAIVIAIRRRSRGLHIPLGPALLSGALGILLLSH